MGNPTLVGPIGSGQISKLANQIIVGVTIGAVAEAITLCEKAGVDANKFINALSGGFADGKILQNHGKRMISKDFSPKGKVSTHYKDMINILECAGDLNTKLPISNLIYSMFESLVDNGNSNDDHSALYNIIYCLFLDIINFLFRKFFLKKKLVIKEEKLLKVRKKYLDGKINAKEYKLYTLNILGNLDKNEYK